MFYFLHIPRTSGESISEEIVGVLDEEHEKDFLRGHLACRPFVFRKNIEFSFSLIREPIDRLLSAYSYTCSKNDDIEALKDKERFLQTVRGRIETPRPFPGFHGQPNMQCAYLYSEMVFIEDVIGNQDSNNSALCELSLDAQSFEDVLNSIQMNKISVHTLENREKCISAINGYMFKRYGRKINGRVLKNGSSSVGFRLNKTEIDEIHDLNSLDYKLYEHFLSHE